jgi:hypothetical protein
MWRELVGDLPTILMQDKPTCFHEVCQLTLGHAPYQFVTDSTKDRVWRDFQNELVLIEDS